MPDPIWYLFHDGAQQGPMPLEELRSLLDQGRLTPDSLVTRVGMADWVPARSVPELFPDEIIMRPPLPPGVGPRRDFLALGRRLTERLRRSVGAEDVVQSLPHLRLVRSLVDGLRRGFTEPALAGADRVARQAGHLGYVAAALLLVLAFLILGMRTESFRIFFTGLLLIAPAAAILHYLAVLFLDAGESLLRKSHSELSSPAILSFLSLAFLLGAVGFFVSALYGIVVGTSFATFGVRMGISVVLLYACGVALNPETVNVGPGKDMTAGEEALGIGMFLIKLPVRLVPFLFGVGSVVGVCAALYLLYLVFAVAGRDSHFVTDELLRIGHYVLAVALLPFLAYVGFACSYLVVELLRAILRTPAKIEELRQDVNGR
ncbi:MAG TPA: DUF4339 domain-containing protein [Thermoanaerobaculia bacterium]|nr:DUF4339 domain-containing protein [Thermoanaerobaculia bacterium]